MWEPLAVSSRRPGCGKVAIWRALQHFVEEGRKAKDLSSVTQLGIDDETHRVELSRRGQNDITLFMDMANRTLLLATEGREAATAKAFTEALIAHGGQAENIEEACIDMHQAFINGLQAQFPNVHLTFDRFHVMKMANEAVGQVSRVEAKEDPELKRSRYCWLKNPLNLSNRQRDRLQGLKRSNLLTAEAYRMKFTLQDFREQPNATAAGRFLAEPKFKRHNAKTPGTTRVSGDSRIPRLLTVTGRPRR